MTILLPLLQREVIIALAIIGAVVATIGSIMIRKDERANTTISLDQPMHHFSLLNHPAAYDAIRDALATAPDPPRHPEIG